MGSLFSSPSATEAENPDVKAGNPDVKAENPDVKAGNPDVKAENPDVKAENPDVKAENPDVKALLSEENPDVKARSSDHVKAFDSAESWQSYWKEIKDSPKPGVAEEYEVRAMPTFVAWKEGKEVERFVGANKVELEKKIKQLSQS
ncbi:hypothetical protein JHK84_051476 [Glycine max]|nr:hypothetical protein JHK84_051476 [Glycine max]